MNAVAKIDEKAEKVDYELPAPQKAPDQPVAKAPEPAPAKPAVVAQPPVKRRRAGRTLVMLALPLALAVGGAYVWVTGGRFQETENANLRQTKVMVASDVSGRIVESNISDNRQVRAGDVLFVVDPQPAHLALEQADAAIAQARLSVDQLRAAYSAAQAQEKLADNEVDYLQSELDRQSALAGKGISTQSALDSAKRDLVKSRDQLAAAKQSVAGALAALGGNADIETDKHPSVMAALAARDKAAYALTQTTVRAPADGVVSQAASFKVGQFVTAGTALFSLVETQDAWIEANFKETQLTHMQLGQQAEVTLDTFPDRPLKATVESIGAGTGAEFSLLPAQNATGNWVKVTQRIPVRLRVEGDDAGLLLRTGMSATVAVDTGVARGWKSLGLDGLFGTAHAAE